MAGTFADAEVIAIMSAQLLMFAMLDCCVQALMIGERPVETLAAYSDGKPFDGSLGEDRCHSL